MYAYYHVQSASKHGENVQSRGEVLRVWELFAVACFLHHFANPNSNPERIPQCLRPICHRSEILVAVTWWVISVRQNNLTADSNIVFQPSFLAAFDSQAFTGLHMTCRSAMCLADHPARLVEWFRGLSAQAPLLVEGVGVSRAGSGAQGTVPVRACRLM